MLPNASKEPTSRKDPKSMEWDLVPFMFVDEFGKSLEVGKPKRSRAWMVYLAILCITLFLTGFINYDTLVMLLGTVRW